MKIFTLIIAILVLDFGICADDLTVFHLVRAKGNQAILEPLIPAQFRVTLVKGEQPEGTIFRCAIIPAVGEGEHRTNILRCGSAEYAVGDVLLSR